MSDNVLTDGGVDPRTVKKVLIVGLDGSTWDIIDPLLARGEMPNIAKILEGGVRARLRSTIPPLTAVAWPTMYTGKDPGGHGIFGFKYGDVSQYPTGEEWVSSRPIAGKTWFDHLGSLGLKVCGYQTPITYPVWPVNGSLVAGYPNPDMSKVFCYPPELAEWIPGLLPTDLALWAARPNQVIPAAREAVERWERTTLRFLEEDKHHFYMFVAHLNDYMVHRFWRLRDPSFPNYDARLAEQLGDMVGQAYRWSDTSIGRLLERVPDDWIVMLVSDHGGGRGPTKWFHLTHWLRQQGLVEVASNPRSMLARIATGLMRQVFRTQKMKNLALRYLTKMSESRVRRVSEVGNAVDYTKSRAYPVYVYQMVPGIAINVRGRQPHGMVEPGAEYEALRDRLIASLKEIRDPKTGRQIVTSAWRREEVYRGPFLERAPDILCYIDEDYRHGWGHRELVTDLHEQALRTMSGAHRMDGLLALHAPGVFRAGATVEGAQMVDVLPTLYHAMGLPVPSDVDGKVLHDAFLPEFLDAHPVRSGPPMGEVAVPVQLPYSEEEEAGIKAALRGLGYVE